MKSIGNGNPQPLGWGETGGDRERDRPSPPSPSPPAHHLPPGPALQPFASAQLRVGGWGFFFGRKGLRVSPLPSLPVFGSRHRAMARFTLSPASRSIFPLPALRSAPAKPSLKITFRIWFVATGTSPSLCFKRESPKYSLKGGKI